ncbi:phospholipase B1, membrane-associated [Aplysia californica]|uniref:Phospholipase B1, membrane-associated n=1 Tax=Aplysia californica TaxID=6500 RepID=A0ABM0ZYT0_APLCA|nr:phospholipase B1, membrane-associated [Aplysia californica]
MVTSGQFDTSDDFTVVLQPMMRELEVPRLPSGDVDYSLMAADCFHFSRKGHALAGIGLWNNLMQPVGKKAAFVDFGTTVHCPDEDRPFLATRRNSVLGLQLGADGPSSNSTTPRASSSKSNTTKKYAAPVVAISALIAMSLVATGLAFWRKKTNNHRLYEKI